MASLFHLLISTPGPRQASWDHTAFLHNSRALICPAEGQRGRNLPPPAWGPACRGDAMTCHHRAAPFQWGRVNYTWCCLRTGNVSSSSSPFEKGPVKLNWVAKKKNEWTPQIASGVCRHHGTPLHFSDQYLLDILALETIPVHTQFSLQRTLGMEFSNSCTVWHLLCLGNDKTQSKAGGNKDSLSAEMPHTLTLPRP